MAFKPIILYSHAGGTNPWKITIFLEELNIRYESKDLEFPSMKEMPFTEINPNCRVPAIEDPNTGVILWESGAILEYLQETYDKRNQFGGDGHDKHKVRQWLHFQMSGQGPYYGQAIWFMRFHPEKVESAIKRYQNEALRIVGVLNAHLQHQNKTWLVGEKYSMADLAFFPWNKALPAILGEEYAGIRSRFPAFVAWHERITAREAVQKAVAMQSDVRPPRPR